MTESIPPRPAADPAVVQHDDAEDAARRQRGGQPRRPINRDEPLPFDLSGISLDLDQPVTVADEPSTTPAGLDDGGDPLSRKLELAEEFQRIGDKDGARDLLREVLADGERRDQDQGAGNARPHQLRHGRRALGPGARVAAPVRS